MEPWRSVWRDALSILLSIDGLEALRKALIEDDEQLVQGITTNSDSIGIVGACAIGYSIWKGERVEDVGSVHQKFAEICCIAEQLTNVDCFTACFLNWFDETERNEMRRKLLFEVNRSLALRTNQVVEEEEPLELLT